MPLSEDNEKDAEYPQRSVDRVAPRPLIFDILDDGIIQNTP
jgi:hypothetical protein